MALHERTSRTNADEVKAAIEAALHEDELEIAEFLVPPDKDLLDYAKSYPRPGMIEKLLNRGIPARIPSVLPMQYDDSCGRSAWT